MRESWRHERIRLRIKARGCTASGRTASYFYIISTWRSAVLRSTVPGVPPLATLLVTFCRSLRYFWKPPWPADPYIPLSLSSLLSPFCISCFLEASHGIHAPEGFVYTSTPIPVAVAHCAGRVYAIQPILILIKSVESIVWA